MKSVLRNLPRGRTIWAPLVCDCGEPAVGIEHEDVEIWHHDGTTAPAFYHFPKCEKHFNPDNPDNCPGWPTCPDAPQTREEES